MIVMGRDHMVIVIVVTRHMMSLWIDDHMVLVPRMGLVVTVMMMLSEYGCCIEHRTDRQHGNCESRLHWLTPKKLHLR